nr:hypothetical protein [Tanacetum cinerariifolium]
MINELRRTTIYSLIEVLDPSVYFDQGRQMRKIYPMDCHPGNPLRLTCASFTTGIEVRSVGSVSKIGDLRYGRVQGGCGEDAQ